MANFFDVDETDSNQSHEVGVDTEGDQGVRHDTDEETAKTSETDSEKDNPDTEKTKTRMELYDWLQCIVSAIICGIFIFVFVGRTIGVDGSSMMQTLHDNDRVIMSNLFYTPKQGDVVVFQTPTEAFGGTPLVKRVIALAGQTIDIDFQTGNVIIDGVIQYEPYIAEPTRSKLNFTGPVTVPEGHVFVMGDNRNHSSDSRDARVGMVDTRYILGRVLVLIIPGSDNEHPRDWNRLGLIH
ncbi:MAG: signal peptidase I [Oscillospiraceae bacterium]|nr:signal peptidase I [Oscillospiraceae bacterium]